MPATALRIDLLGDFRLVYRDAPVTGLDSPRLRALLAYLLLHREAPQQRQHLAFLLWPDSSEAQARTNLRKNLFLLRQALPHADSYLLLQGQSVGWRADASFTLDVAEFEAAVSGVAASPDPAKAQQGLERAAALYVGDLLPGCYDEWCLAERERLGRTYETVLDQLIATLERQRAYDAAATYSRRLLQRDPLDEGVVRTLMRLLALSGNRAGALSTYHVFATALQRELDADPSPETQQTYERLLHTVASPATPASVERRTLPLVGRNAEWTLLQRTWHAAGSGTPQFVVISGEAGIGKTRLMEELLDWVSRQGGETVRTVCRAGEDSLAYAPVVGWLRSEAILKRLVTMEPIWLTEVTRLLPELLVERPALSPPRPLTEGWQRRIFFEALARAALSGGALLQIDDLQWCDGETLSWLHYLLGFAAQRPLCMVGTMRPEEVTDRGALNELLFLARREGYLTEILLGPLDQQETALLAAHVAGQELAPADAARLYAATEGNPLFVVETLRTGLQARPGARGGPDGGFELPETIPAAVRAVIFRRLSHLSLAARELAEQASVFGREFTAVTLAGAAEMDEDSLLRGLDELWQRRIVRERLREAGQIEAPYEFSHGRIRDSAYAALSLARRRLLHRRAARALEAVHALDLDMVSGQLGQHYEQAGLAERAASFYQRAAEVSERIYAQQDAIRYYRRALALLDDLSRQAPQAAALVICEKLGDILHLTGQYDGARAAYSQGLAQGVALGRVRRAGLYRKIGNTWREQGRYELAFQTYGEAAKALGPEPAEGATQAHAPEVPSVRWWQERIAIQYELVQAHYWLGQADDALALLEALRPLVERYGTPYQRAHIFVMFTGLTLQRERMTPSESSMAYLRLAQAAVAESGLAQDVPSIPFQLGFYLLWHGNLAEAEAYIGAALPLAERSGDITLRARCLTYLTMIHRKQGRDAEVRRLVTQALEVALAAQMPEYVALARAQQAWLAWRGGELSGVEAQGRAALDLWAQLAEGDPRWPFRWTVLWPLLAAALRVGDVAQAIGHARAMLHPSQQRLPADLTTPLERAIQAEQDHGEAHKWLSEAVQRAGQTGYL